MIDIGKTMPPCHLIVAPGGDPAPIAGMIWALRQRVPHLEVQHLHLIFYEEAHKYYQREFLEGHAPAQQLQMQGHHWQTHTHLVRTRAGVPLKDDTDLDDATRFVEAIWKCAQEAQELAGPQPVVFALLGGRRRTLTVDITLTFQLLARHQDLLFDLRPVPKEVSGPESGFYFPTQTHPTLVYDTQNNAYPPSEVGLELVPVHVPRLRPLLKQPPDTFAEALYQSESALIAHELPRLTIDLSEQHVFFEIPGNKVKLTLEDICFFWYAILAFAAKQGTREVSLRNPAPLTELLKQCSRDNKEKNRIIKSLSDPNLFSVDRTILKRKIEKVSIEKNIPNINLLIPRTKRSGIAWVHWIDLPASHIHILGTNDQG